MAFLGTTRTAAIDEDSTAYRRRKSAQLFTVSGDSKACKKTSVWEIWQGPWSTKEQLLMQWDTSAIKEILEEEIQFDRDIAMIAAQKPVQEQLYRIERTQNKT